MSSSTEADDIVLTPVSSLQSISALHTPILDTHNIYNNVEHESALSPTASFKRPLPTSASSLPSSASTLTSPHFQQIPTILLEILKARTLKLVLFFTYFCVVVAIVVGIVEQDWTQTYIHYDQPYSFCPTCSNSSTWSQTLQIDPINMYFSVDLAISRDQANIPQNAFNQNVNFTVHLLGYNPSTNHTLYADTLLTTINCNDHSDCSLISILQPDSWEYEYEDIDITYTYFNITVHTSYRLESLGHLTYTITYQNTTFRIASMIIHLTAILCTLFYFGYWCYTLYHRGLSYVLPEQKWITLLFIALILYQDPFYVAVLLVQLRVYRILSGICFFLSFTYFLIFWLNMLDGARATRKQIKSHKFNVQTHQIDVHSYLNFDAIKNMDDNSGISTTTTDPPLQSVGHKQYSYTWVFYAPKVALGLIVCISSIIFEVSNNSPVVADLAVSQDATHYGYKSDQTRNVLLYSSLIILISAVVFWILWMLYCMCKAQQELRKLPYLATRFRQLSFRFFVLQTGFVIIYQIFMFIFQWAQHGIYSVNLGLSRTGFLSNVIITTVYMWLVAFVYLPITAKQQQKHHVSLHATHKSINYFSLYTAYTLCELSWQAYFSPPLKDLQTEPFIEYEDYVDLNAKGFKGLLYKVSTIFDIHAYITLSADQKYVIAFRGTASQANTKADLKVSRMPFKVKDETVGLVHSGFLMAYEEVREDIIGYVRTLVQQHKASHTKGQPHPLMIYITGHSLGGGLATLCALEVATLFQYEVHVCLYNFGSPRVGDHTFARHFNQHVPLAYRIVFDRDLITTIPKLCFLYKHIGTEILVDGTGNMIVAPTFVEKPCFPVVVH